MKVTFEVTMEEFEVVRLKGWHTLLRNGHYPCDEGMQLAAEALQPVLSAAQGALEKPSAAKGGAA